MKKSIKLKYAAVIVILAAGMLGFSCSQDELERPSISFIMVGEDGSEILPGGTVKAKQPVTFKFEGDAEYLTIWTGNLVREKLTSKVTGGDSLDTSGNVVYKVVQRRAYADRGKVFPGETNEILRGQKVAYDLNLRRFSDFSYSYPEAGDYTVSVIAVRSGEYGENVGQVLLEKQIKVIE